MHWAWSLAALGLIACSSEAQGTVAVSVYGEALIEEGIGADATSDGWAIDFEHFVVSIRDVSIAGQRVPDVEPIDLAQPTQGAGHLIGEVTAQTGDYSDAQFTIDRLEIEGSADKDGVRKTFNWLIEDEVVYADCDATTSINEDAQARFQVTVHADHLFHDSLVAETPNIVFSPYAQADGNDNGMIEVDGELWEASIGDFDPGNLEARNLWVWLFYASRSLGHVNGESHCVASAMSF